MTQAVLLPALLEAAESARRNSARAGLPPDGAGGVLSAFWRLLHVPMRTDPRALTLLGVFVATAVLLLMFFPRRAQ